MKETILRFTRRATSICLQAIECERQTQSGVLELRREPAVRVSSDRGSGRRLEAGNLVQQFDFDREAIRRFQDRKRHPQVRRQRKVRVEIEPRARVRQIVELTGVDRLANLLFGQSFECHLLSIVNGFTRQPVSCEGR